MERRLKCLFDYISLIADSPDCSCRANCCDLLSDGADVSFGGCSLLLWFASECKAQQLVCGNVTAIVAEQIGDNLRFAERQIS